MKSTQNNKKSTQNNKKSTQLNMAIATRYIVLYY